LHIPKPNKHFNHNILRLNYCLKLLEERVLNLS
jgi:hypothetical protein